MIMLDNLEVLFDFMIILVLLRKFMGFNLGNYFMTIFKMDIFRDNFFI